MGCPAYGFPPPSSRDRLAGGMRYTLALRRRTALAGRREAVVSDVSVRAVHHGRALRPWCLLPRRAATGVSDPFHSSIRVWGGEGGGRARAISGVTS